MAKIMLIAFQPIIGNSIKDLVCYYESIIQELTKEGNEILVLNNFYIETHKYKKVKRQYISTIVEQVKNFAPDIIFSFNNQIYEDIINVTNCPILSFEADLVEFMANKELVRKYSDRYYLVSFYPKFVSDYFALGFKKEHIINLHCATSIQKESLEKKNEISFIGTRFATIKENIASDLLQNNSSNLYELYKDFYKTPSYDYKNLLSKYLNLTIDKEIDYYGIFDYRIYVLQSIYDLGLKLYGIYWDRLPLEYIQLMTCFDKTPTYSLKHNQDLYNSSKINLSISHPQCKGYSFPWRIYDIMASDGLLITSESKLLDEITKDFVKVPSFNSPYEVRDLCKYALNNPNYCKDIIEASNKFIEKHGRWSDNFKVIEDITNIKLVNLQTNKIGSSCFVELELKPESEPFLHNLKIKQRLAIISGAFQLILGQIPLVDLILANKLKRLKLKKKILKYWR